MSHFRCSVRFVLKDAWVGAYFEPWTRWRMSKLLEDRSYIRFMRFRVFVCLLPCVPIVLEWHREIPIPYDPK